MQEQDAREGIRHPAPQGPAPEVSALMFWLLVLPAVVTFVPCIVLPVWRDYQATVLATRFAERDVALLRAEVERQRRTLTALRTDPAVAARLAQRELAYHRPGEEVVRTGNLPASAAFPAFEPVAAHVSAPRPVARIIARLPDLHYDELFCRGPTRLVLMLLSGGLVATALALYPPGGRRPTTGPGDAEESSGGP